MKQFIFSNHFMRFSSCFFLFSAVASAQELPDTMGAFKEQQQFYQSQQKNSNQDACSVGMPKGYGSNLGVSKAQRAPGNLGAKAAKGARQQTMESRISGLQGRTRTRRGERNSAIIKGTFGDVAFNGKGASVFEAKENDGIIPDIRNVTNRVLFPEDVKKRIIRSKIANFEENGKLVGDVDVFRVDTRGGELLAGRLIAGKRDKNANFFVLRYTLSDFFQEYEVYEPNRKTGNTTFSFRESEGTVNLFVVLEAKNLNEVQGPDLFLDNLAGNPVSKEGAYTLLFTKNLDVEKKIKVKLNKGEVFGIASAPLLQEGVFGNISILNSLTKPDGELAFQNSEFNRGTENSPLPKNDVNIEDLENLDDLGGFVDEDLDGIEDEDDEDLDDVADEDIDDSDDEDLDGVEDEAIDDLVDEDLDGEENENLDDEENEDLDNIFDEDIDGLGGIVEISVPVSEFSYVVPETGEYELSIRGVGEFEVEINALPVGLARESKQYIYLDMTRLSIALNELFNEGEDEDVIRGNPDLNKVRKLSRLRSFMGDMGIEDTDQNFAKLTRKITNFVKRTVETDLRASKINPNFAVKIVSDFGREGLGKKIPEMFAKNNIKYSRVLVGGTQKELSLSVIGRSGVIDVGNYDPEDTAVLLLDRLTAPVGSELEFRGPNMNKVEFAESTTKIDLAAVMIGHKICHQIGHLLGCYHTRSGGGFSIMDSSADPFHILGLPKDGVFGRDEIVPHVGFTKDAYTGTTKGLNETDVVVAFALSQKPQGSSSRKASKPNDTFDQALDALEAKVLNESLKYVDNKMFNYPSPAVHNQMSTLVIQPEFSGVANVTLYDIKGVAISTVYSGELTAGQLLELEVDFAQLNMSPGFYMYRLISDNGGVQAHSFLVK